MLKGRVAICRRGLCWEDSEVGNLPVLDGDAQGVNGCAAEDISLWGVKTKIVIRRNMHLVDVQPWNLIPVLAHPIDFLRKSSVDDQSRSAYRVVATD